jgi:nicotinamidase-related amidase
MKTDDVVFVLVDVQGKLAQLMHGKEGLFDSLQRLVKGMRVLEVPIIWMEQIPEKMGETIPELRELLAGEEPVSKACFSCCGSGQFVEKLKALGRRRVVLAGIETHVCVYQTAADLVEMGYDVEIVADATSSRTEFNKQIGLEKIRRSGAGVTSVETCLLELTGRADHPAFRDILKIVK